jgi:hypothetical protein
VPADLSAPAAEVAGVEEFVECRTGFGGAIDVSQIGQPDMIVPVESGVCLTIPLGTHFQFRSLGAEPLCALGVTMPPWPGEGEAIMVQGKWEASLR